MEKVRGNGHMLFLGRFQFLWSFHELTGGEAAPESRLLRPGGRVMSVTLSLPFQLGRIVNYSEKQC